MDLLINILTRSTLLFTINFLLFDPDWWWPSSFNSFFPLTVLLKGRDWLIIYFWIDIPFAWESIVVLLLFYFLLPISCLLTLMSGSVRFLPPQIGKRNWTSSCLFSFQLQTQRILTIKLSNYWEVMLLESKSRSWSFSARG